MLVNAITLVQDVQLVCFSLIFAFFAFQHWEDKARRWLWYSFLANGAGALLDFTGSALPAWLSVGLDSQMIPLSYVLTNVAILRFLNRMRWAEWAAWALLAAVGCPAIWLSVQHAPICAYGLQDLGIALECLLSAALLLAPSDASTRAPRRLMGWFMLVFAVLELTRVGVVAATGLDPDTFSHQLEIVSAVSYVVNTSILPLGFVWMINTRIEAELRHQAVIDPLTQVLNRRGLRVELDRELARHRRTRTPLTVAIADLDHFKQWNDRYGHASGDAVLTTVATLLRMHLRATDVLARVGGEEFVLLLPGTSAEEAKTLLERLCVRVSEIATDGGSLATADGRITMSFGAAVSSSEYSAATLLHNADIALYQAKHDGRNCVRIYNPATAPEAEFTGEMTRAHRWHGLTETAGA